MIANLEIDIYVDPEPTGLQRALYIGDSCEPIVEKLETWEEIIDRNIAYYKVPGSDTLLPCDLESLMELVAGLEYAAALFRSRIQDLSAKSGKEYVEGSASFG